MSGPEEQIPEIRAMSVVLSTFPWMSDFVLQSDHGMPKDPSYAVFFNTMRKLERQLHDGSHSMEALDVRQAMSVVKPGTVTFPSAVDISPATGRKLCSVISAYRLMDVLYALQSLPAPFQNPRYGKLPRQGLVLGGKHWPLEDWVLSLEEGQKSMGGLEWFPTPTQPPASASMDLVATGFDDYTLQAMLFRALHGFSKQAKRSNMLHNLQVAAFHLSFMLKGHTANNKLAVPNIPDSCHPLVNGSIAQSAILTKEELDYLDEFREGKELFKLRHPLYAALLFSPLYLLTGRKMHNNAWDQSRMLQLSKAFGNEKPDILVRIELNLWRALIKVATGRELICQAMQTFFANLPLDELSGLPTEDREFFSMKSPKIEEDSLASFLLCVKGETALSVGWPLSQLRWSIMAMDECDVQDAAAEEGVPAESLVDDMQMATEDEQGDPDTEEEARAKKRPRRSKVDSSPLRRSDRKRTLAKKGLQSFANTDKRWVNRKKNPKLFIPFQQIRDGAYLQLIEVEDKLEATFDPSVDRQRVRGKEFSIMDPSGVHHLWRPEFHFQDDLDKFEAFKALVKSCEAPNGHPRYLEKGYQSSVEVIPYTQYQGLSTSEVQKRLRLRHLVITGVPTDETEFDESGLQELTNLDSKVHFQDQSIPVVDGDMSVQLRVGTLEDILNFSIWPKILMRDKLSGEIEAWRLTEGLPFCGNKALYPTSDMRWGLAATAGARHWIHLDCEGLGTIVELLCGLKWWILFKPHLHGEPDSTAHVDLFLDDFDPSVVVKTWDVEAVLLTPGTRLIMKPNTPHAIFTAEHTIALGGHFYSLTNLQDTVSAIIHCFAINNIMTNTEHPETRMLLFRMMQYLDKFYVKGADTQKNKADHLPDLMKFMSLVDVLSLCSYCIMANILDHNTYQFPLSKGRKPTASELGLRDRYDYNALSPLKRQYFTYIRGLALNLLTWITCNYDVISTNQEDPPVKYDPCEFMMEVISPFISNQAYAILNYKCQAEAQKLPGIPNCTAADVQRQFELLFYDNPSIGIEMDFDSDLSAYKCFAFGDCSWCVTKRPSPIPFRDDDPYTIGTTKGDKMFAKGATTGFPSSKGQGVSNQQ